MAEAMVSNSNRISLEQLDGTQRDLLWRWAAKYIWWKTPDETLRLPQRVVAQVMTIGDYDDVRIMVQALGNDALREVLRGAEAGMSDAQSWTY